MSVVLVFIGRLLNLLFRTGQISCNIGVGMYEHDVKEKHLSERGMKSCSSASIEVGVNAGHCQPVVVNTTFRN